MRDHMEQSLRQASSNQPFHDPAPPLVPDDGHVADSVGKLSLTDNHAVYIGSTHWGTILAEVRCVGRKFAR
jgi:hypothetical protein